jgi:hypothetical protein
VTGRSLGRPPLCCSRSGSPPVRPADREGGAGRQAGRRGSRSARGPPPLRPRAPLSRSGAHVSGVWSPPRAGGPAQPPPGPANQPAPHAFPTTERTRAAPRGAGPTPPRPMGARNRRGRKQPGLTRGPGPRVTGPRTGKGGRETSPAFPCPTPHFSILRRLLERGESTVHKTNIKIKKRKFGLSSARARTPHRALPFLAVVVGGGGARQPMVDRAHACPASATLAWARPLLPRR